MRRIGTRTRRGMSTGVLVLAALLLLAACGGGSAPSSAVLLTTAAAKLTADQSFHFEVTEDNAGTPSGDSVDVASASGDVVVPDRLSGTAQLNTGAFGMQTEKVIVVGNQAWLTNPLTGQYQRADQFALFPSAQPFLQHIKVFFSAGIAALLTSLEDVSAPSDGSANGVPCWKITGNVSTDKLSALTGGQVSAGQKIPTTICIGKDDGQLHSVSVKGKLTPFDTDQTTRTIMLSNFNKPVTIEPPAGS